MTHQLILDPSWERAISKKDRQAILALYEETPLVKNEVWMTPIRVALNHRGALLAMVIIQNNTNHLYHIAHYPLIYEEYQVLAEYHFKDSKVIVPGGKSMPWTFMFPKDSLLGRPLLKDWRLKIKEKHN